MAPDPQPPAPQPSYGNMGEGHWSRTRSERNREALEYYRERSHAPGVAEGGTERNFYCMQCDGVIPFELEGGACPHCGAELDEHVKRYFNWVEINETPTGDARAVLRLAVPVVILLIAGLALAWWMAS